MSLSLSILSLFVQSGFMNGKDLCERLHHRMTMLMQPLKDVNLFSCVGRAENL
jgi:hypothetical protein